MAHLHTLNKDLVADTLNLFFQLLSFGVIVRKNKSRAGVPYKQYILFEVFFSEKVGSCIDFESRAKSL